MTDRRLVQVAGCAAVAGAIAQFAASVLEPDWGGLRWTAAASAVLVLAGDLVEIGFDAAFLVVIAGYVLFLVVVTALGVSMLRREDAVPGALITTELR